jgi:hypothetical protein
MESAIFLRSLFPKLSLSSKFFSTIVLRKTVKTRKAADRDFSGAHVNQNFPYSTKKLNSTLFPSRLSKCAAVFTLEIFILWPARIFSKRP